MSFHLARYHAPPPSCDCMEVAEQNLVHDSRSGDTICTECARVVETHAFDQRPEWYGDASSRAGHVDKFEDFLGQQTVPVRHVRYQEPDPHKNTRAGLKHVERCGSMLHLDPNHQICMHAKRIYTDFVAARKAEGCCVRENQRICAAACALYFGCKIAGSGCARTIAEIAAVVSLSSESCVDMTKAFRNALVGKPYHDAMCTAVQPEDVLMRALETVTFEKSEHKFAVMRESYALFARVKERNALEGRWPETVCAAVLFRSFEKVGIKTTKETVFKACGITNATLTKALNDIKDI